VACLFVLHFCLSLEKEKILKRRVERPLEHFPVTEMVVICILKNQGKKECFVVCLHFEKGFAAGPPRC